MSWTLSTSGAAISKAGANANSTIIASGATLAKWSDEVESSLCALTKYDWVTNYSSVKTYFKPILDDIVSDGVALKIINYDMSGFTSRSEAQTMLNILHDNFSRNVEALQDKDTQSKMGV